MALNSEQTQLINNFLTGQPAFERAVIAIDLIAATTDLRIDEDLSRQHAINMTVTPAGELTAASLKWFNVVRLRPLDFLLAVSKISLSVLAGKPETIQAIGLNTIAGWLLVLFEFNALFKHQFSEQSAQLLYAIALLRQSFFTTDDLQRRYAQEFGQALSADQLQTQLRLLCLWKCLLPAESGYHVNESIQVNRTLE